MMLFAQVLTFSCIFAMISKKNISYVFWSSKLHGELCQYFSALNFTKTYCLQAAHQSYKVAPRGNLDIQCSPVALGTLIVVLRFRNVCGCDHKPCAACASHVKHFIRPSIFSCCGAYTLWTIYFHEHFEFLKFFDHRFSNERLSIVQTKSLLTRILMRTTEPHSFMIKSPWTFFYN